MASKLVEYNWIARVTQGSGDNGVDIIAERNRLTVAIQNKRYKGSVGNKAIQEVYTGMKHFGLSRAVVISTGVYTKAAKNIALSLSVLLLSEHDIPHMWDILNIRD